MVGKRLSDITFEEAGDIIKKGTVIVLPIGGGSKEHGPHLPCGTDFYVVEELAKRVVESCPVLLIPTLPYAYYPAFIDWAGSVSIEARHFMDIVGDILKSFIRHGAKKFLIIDGGISTHCPLKILSSDLNNEFGVDVAVTDLSGIGKEVEMEVCEQKKGGHADEGETSCMLRIRPELVKMDRAVEDYSPSYPGIYRNGVKKISMGGKMDTKSGANGNSKPANSEKGEKILQAMAEDIINFLNYFIDDEAYK